MIKRLPNGNLNLEGIEVAVVQAPHNNGSIGRLTLSAPLGDDLEGTIKFFEDPMTILELEIIYNAIIISKRVWATYDYDSHNAELSETCEVAVIIADYECRSTKNFSQSFQEKTVRTVHISDANSHLECGVYDGKYTADIYMCSVNDQIPSFTNSAFRTNVSMIFIDTIGDLPSFIIRKVIPFIEGTIQKICVPCEYDVVFEHHIISVGGSGECVSIMSSIVGLRINDKVYSIIDCTPSSIVYNADIWNDAVGAELFKTVVRTTFVSGDYMRFPICVDNSTMFILRPVAYIDKKSIYGDKLVYEVPECVTIRFIRKQYLNVPIDTPVGVFNYRYARTIEIGDRWTSEGASLSLDQFAFETQDKPCIEDLNLPRIIVKVDRDRYDKYCYTYPMISNDKKTAWREIAKDVQTSYCRHMIRFELLACDMREVVFGYW